MATPQIPWARVLVEGVVIVASILLALAADAWWDGVQETRDEREALERLDRELTQVDRVLVEWRAYHVGVVEACEMLLEHTGPGGAPALSSDSVGTLLAPITWGWTIDLADVTLSTLDASGQLRAVRNHELIEALTTWRAVMADLQGDEFTAEELVNRDLTPFLTTHTAWVTIGHFDRGLIEEGMAPPRRSRFPDDLSALLTSREFENLIELRRTYTATAVSDYDAARASLDRVRDLIGRELAG